MIYLVVFVIAVLVGLVFPPGAGIVIVIANAFLPDPFPFVDEVGMVIGILGRRSLE